MRVRNWLVLLLRALASRVLDRLDDPRETLDYAYQRQLELQQTMRRGLADVVTARKRLALLGRELEASIERLEVRSRLALEQEQEEAAREALTRRAMFRAELADLRVQDQALASEEAKMNAGSRVLEFQIRQFRIRKEAASATYSAATARALVGESAVGLNPGSDDLLLALQRAQGELLASQARSDALDSLMASGALGPPSLAGDAFHPQLDMNVAEVEAAAELARLKGDVARQAPRALDQGRRPDRVVDSR
jgi:phage shock protein A